MEFSTKLTENMIQDGYFETEEAYVCLYCQKKFIKHKIYRIDEDMYDDIFAIRHHLEKQHGGTLKAVLNLPNEVTGISQSQKKIMNLLGLDLTDEEIAEQLEISTSTIRNHRFKLKEKKRQALYFISAIEMLERRNKKMISDEISISTYDERFHILEIEREKVLTNFVDSEGKVATIPRKEKSKIIILQYVIECFFDDKVYKEAEVNEIIKQKFEDYVTIRRYLIQYGFLARTKDGSKYWKI